MPRLIAGDSRPPHRFHIGFQAIVAFFSNLRTSCFMAVEEQS
jgi:hypothetical protein